MINIMYFNKLLKEREAAKPKESGVKQMPEPKPKRDKAA